MLTFPVLLDLAHDTRQRIAVGASGVMCRILSLVGRTTSGNPAIPRLAVVTAFAQLLDLLEYWVGLISKSTSEVSKAKEKDDCPGRTSRAETFCRVQIDMQRQTGQKHALA